MTAAETHHRIGAAITQHVDAVVDAMDQKWESDPLRRRRFIRRDLCMCALGGIRVRRIVAQHAVFGVVAQRAVHG